MCSPMRPSLKTHVLRSVLDAYADIQVVGEAGSGEEAVHLVDQLRPAVVVMDINGIEETTQVKLQYPETIIIGLSVNAEGENQEAMKRAGAVRIMTKEAAAEDLYDAILHTTQSRRQAPLSDSSLAS